MYNIFNFQINWKIYFKKGKSEFGVVFNYSLED